MVKRMTSDQKRAQRQSNSIGDDGRRGRIARVGLLALSALCCGHGAADAQNQPQSRCKETVVAKVVALDQAFYVNRYGALQAGGMVFALERDVVSMDPGNPALQAGKVMVRADKRPRPLTLRVNKGQCLEIQFRNLLTPKPVNQNVAVFPPVPAGGYQPNQQQLVPSDGNPLKPNGKTDQNGNQSQPPTRYAGVHVAGMEWVSSSADDGSFVGANDVAANDLNGKAKLNGLIPPEQAPFNQRITTTLFAAEEGAFLLTSGGTTVGAALDYGGQLSEGLFGSVIVQPSNAEYYRSQVSRDELDAATVKSAALPDGWRLGPAGPSCTSQGDRSMLRELIREPKDQKDPNRGTSCVKVMADGFLYTLGDQPVINYDAVFGAQAKRAGDPVLSMLKGKRGDARRELIASDLTAMITGPYAGMFGPAKPPTKNDTYPELQQPYREFAIHYHDDFLATQAFQEFRTGGMQYTLQGGRDFFAINYGMGGIGAIVWANRIQVGPASGCATCKFEEFFLSSWPNGDPAMVVDQPANVAQLTPPRTTKATKAFFPDDPSNVYHSYLRDHVKFRILHAGTNITHVHHQHAHQWLHSPKSGLSAYRDSQMISPGAAYTLDMVYGGSGNKNLTVGDSIFHCHFYPHFAQGMWSLWRVHDVFERGTRIGANGIALNDGPNRALPDGEIAQGTPIPGLVPLPTLAMAPVPARVEIKSVQETAPNGAKVDRPKVVVNEDDLKAGQQPGYPFFIPGIAGQRAPHPPMSYAPELDANGKQVEIAGEKQRLDGGLPRNVAVAELGSAYEQHNRWDFSKDNDQLFARELPEDGDAVEKATMKVYQTRNHPSFTSVGTPAPFVYNGQPAVHGAPFANPAVHYNGDPVKTCVPTDPNCNGANFEGRKLTYKSANIQTDVVLNKKGWHYPQQRMSVLWEDVKPTLDGKRRPEPLFMRANSGDVVEFWLTNLIPNYYELDDFQVRTPTDVVGQHIHLVKFDVMTSDGAGNGWNYESGSLAAEEVRGLIGAINKAGGMVGAGGSQKTLTAKTIPDLAQHFPAKGDPLILGAQATVELWYVDPLTDICRQDDQKESCPKEGLDRTMGTVFTHDHFGPSTHQQAGLYAGLIIEPANSQWLTATTLAPMGGNDPATGKPVMTRADGGPTSWAAVIKGKDQLYREFLIEFQDRQLTYSAASRAQPKPYQRYQPKAAGVVTRVQPDGAWGWTDIANSINPPLGGGQFTPNPQLVTNTFGAGAWSLNYRNEPLDLRLSPGTPNATTATDTAFAFASIRRNDAALNVQPTGPISDPCAAVKADVTIVGDLAPGPVWMVNGKMLTNNGTVPLKAGQVVCFGIKAGTHGLLFPTEAVGKSLFDIAGSPQAGAFVPNPRGPTTCGQANTFGTVPQSSGIIAVLHVLGNVTVTTPIPFECSQHCANMAGSFTMDDTLNIAGDQDSNNNHFWTVDGKRLDNNGSVSLKRGQLVRFTVKAGTHGLLFKNQAAAQAVFDIAGSPQASKFVANPNGPNTCSLASSYGTAPQATVTTNPAPGQNTIAELKVLANATMSGGLDFECSQHCANMAGSFEIGEVMDIVGDSTGGNHWEVDGNWMANGNTLQLTAGQKVRFSVKAGMHGLMFTDQATAEAIFDIAGSPQASKFVNLTGANACGFANAYGTMPQAAVTSNPQPGQNTIAELVVKQSVTLTQPGGWMCSQHCQNMQGLFVPADTGFVVADPGKTRWLVDNEELANNTALPLVPGSKLRFSANAPGDTLFFPDKTAPAALFDDASAFTSMNQCTFNDGVGLALTAGSFTELTVKKQNALLSARFMSANQCTRMEGMAQPVIPVPPFTYPAKFEGAEPFDPYTPLMRAYPGDTVEVRTLVGAHMAPHSLNMHGVKWLFEQNSPNSGFRSTQGMGISEYYHMRFNVPTTNGGADYLYATTSDTKGLEYGQWGLLRSYSSPQADLPPIQTAPAKVADVCPAGAPVRKYSVSAVEAATAIADGKLYYNSRGNSRGLEPDGGAAGKLFGDAALLYVHDEDLDLTVNPVKIKPGKRIEPLVLRAAAGDCIEVTLTNRLPSNMDLPQRSGSQKAFSAITIRTSLQIGLHPQQVGMDILTGNGVNLGNNPPQTIAPALPGAAAQSKVLKWYAGSIDADGTHTPVELGAIGLSPADPLMQHPFGLLGALIIEPAGATWRTDDNSRAQATVAVPSAKQFREFVVVLQDDVQRLFATDASNVPCGGTNNGSPSQVTTVAVNYRTEPLPCRYYAGANTFDTATPSLATLGMARALSNSQVLADPETPVLAVSRGVPTRLRVVHPGGLNEQVFTLAGHPWQEEPFRNNSREIGDNAASQAFGARDSFGANDQFNIVLNSAGGRKQVAGDYLYRSFIGTTLNDGVWGVMRVGEPNSDIVAIAHASPSTSGMGYVISGANTVNPNNGKMAANVTITANVTNAPQPVTCIVPVDQVTGQWDTSSCLPAQQGVLVVDPAHPVNVVSAGGGRASVTGPIPSTRPVQASFAEVAMTLQRAKEKAPVVEAKEIVQFRGAPTPMATMTSGAERSAPVVDPIVPAGRSRGAGNDQGLVQPSTPAATMHRPDH
jgi:cold shock CspA family protein